MAMNCRWEGGMTVPMTGSPPLGAMSQGWSTAAIQYSRVAPCACPVAPSRSRRRTARTPAAPKDRRRLAGTCLLDSDGAVHLGVDHADVAERAGGRERHRER